MGTARWDIIRSFPCLFKSNVWVIIWWKSFAQQWISVIRSVWSTVDHFGNSISPNYPSIRDVHECLIENRPQTMDLVVYSLYFPGRPFLWDKAKLANKMIFNNRCILSMLNIFKVFILCKRWISNVCSVKMFDISLSESLNDGHWCTQRTGMASRVRPCKR